MAQVIDVKRVFRYGQVILDDPDTSMTPEEVKEFWSSGYKELTQSVVEGPEYEGDTIVYTFRKAVGTKG